jgi:Transposase DDE domain
MRVEAMVRQLVGGCSPVVHVSRLAAVVKVVEGIVRADRLVPATIGRNLPGRANPKHGIKCVDRLLGNPHMVTDRRPIFQAVAQLLLHGGPKPVILVDWTKSGGTHEALVAAVPIGGRALPIYLEVHPRKKLGNAAVEGKFLAALKTVLPPECQAVIVSDAGFKGPFFRTIRELGWDFLGRIRGTAKAITADGRTIAKEEFYAQASTTPTDLGLHGLFVQQRIPCRLVLVRKRRKPGRKPPPPKCKEERELRQSALDPWLLATSLSDSDASYVVALYARRMQIEETFRDAKSHRFGWSLGTVRLSTHHRVAVLLVLAALALVVVTLIGMGAERRGTHRAYQANTRERRVLSFFALACAIISRRGVKRLSEANFRSSLNAIPSLVNA